MMMHFRIYKLLCNEYGKMWDGPLESKGHSLKAECDSYVIVVGVRFPLALSCNLSPLHVGG